MLAGIIPDREQVVIQPLIQKARHLVWNGHCKDIPALMRDCDVLVLPSAQDGFGLVVLEAFACGLPVIVSNRVGAGDCVSNHETGFIVPFGDERALEEKMDWFLQDRSRAQQMRTAVRHAAERHSWEAYGKRLVSLFDSI